MKLHLYYPTEKSVDIAVSQTLACTNADSAQTLYFNRKGHSVDKLLSIASAGHTTVLEMIPVSFSVESASRYLSFALFSNRYNYRFISGLQQSMRYVTAKKDFYVPSLENSEEYYTKINSYFNAYEKLVELGVPEEDARYVLPKATFTNLSITTNLLSALSYIVRNRNNPDAMPEEREFSLCLLVKLNDTMSGMINGIDKLRKNLKWDLQPACGLEEIISPEKDDTLEKNNFLLESVATTAGNKFNTNFPDLTTVSFYTRGSIAMQHQMIRHNDSMLLPESFESAGKKWIITTPKTIKNIKSALKLYNTTLSEAREYYNKLYSEIGQEARYAILNAVNMKAFHKFNGESLMNLIMQRTCNRAQWEIREVITKLQNSLPDEIKKATGPRCTSQGKCIELKSCGQK